MLHTLPDPPGGPSEGGLSRAACRWLAGVDVGLAAALSALTWFMFHSWLRGEFWWAKLNVAGAIFYGPRVYLMGLGRASLAGFSALLIIYVVLGALFSVLARERGYARNLMLALLWAMGWHLVFQKLLWRSLDAFGPAYFPIPATMPAHLVCALCLSRFASRFQSLALSFGNPAWTEEFAEAAAVKPAPPLAAAIPAEAEGEGTEIRPEPPNSAVQDEPEPGAPGGDLAASAPPPPEAGERGPESPIVDTPRSSLE